VRERLVEQANKQPLTRYERHSSRDKESKERALLEKRPPVRGQRYINYGKGIASADAGTVAHITEQDRFFTDFADEEKKRREHTFAVKQEQLNRRRFEQAMAEEERWRDIDSQWAAAEARESSRKAVGAPRNKSSVPYNPLTLRYEDSADGDMLRFTDDQIRFRAAQRAERLRAHQSKDGYNPVTGDPATSVRVPPAPQPPGGRPF